jgi:hypothetical protein
VARTLLQAAGIRALDNQEVRADAGDPDPAQGFPGHGMATLAAGQERDPARRAQRGQSIPVDQRQRAALVRQQALVDLALADLPDQRSERLLPEQRDDGVGHHQQAGDDQHGREVERQAAEQRPALAPPAQMKGGCPGDAAAHRRRADLVPPSEPGPA